MDALRRTGSHAAAIIAIASVLDAKATDGASSALTPNRAAFSIRAATKASASPMPGPMTAINQVMSALLHRGIEITALHHHFFWDNPRAFFMHIHGHGNAVVLANRLKPALDWIGLAKEGEESAAPKTPSKPATTLHTERIAKIVGHPGEQNGPVYKITLGRDDLNVEDMGASVNARMGLNTWAAFVGTNGDAAVAGHIAMLEK